MSMGKALHQMSAAAERSMVGDGEAVPGVVSDEAGPTRHGKVDAGPGLLAQVLARENMQRAWKRVKANKGAAGVDGMDIIATGRYLAIWLSGERIAQPPCSSDGRHVSAEPGASRRHSQTRWQRT
jgi:hypothetical protein